MASNSPLPHEQLETTVQNACKEIFASVTTYDSGSTHAWSNSIVNKVLPELVSHVGQTEDSPQYKYIVNTSIIQHDLKSSSAAKPNTSGVATRDTTTDTQSDGNTEVLSDSTALGANEASARDDDIPIAGGASDERSSGSVSVERSDATSSAQSASTQPEKARVGIHNAMGAYWNAETDGSYIYKFEGGEEKDFDAVVSVLWIQI